MKKTLFTTLFSSLFLFSMSQSFSESMFMDYAFSDGTKPSIHIHFSNVGKDALYDALKTAFKSKDGKIEKVKNNSDEYIVSNFVLKNNKPSKANIKLLEVNSQADMMISFENNESIISEQQAMNDINYYKEFSYNIAVIAVNLEFDNQINALEKTINKKNKEIKQLEKEVVSNEKRIQDAEHFIKQSNSNIENSKKNIEESSVNINNTDQNIKELNQVLRQKSEKNLKKNIKELEKINDKLSKSIENIKVR